MFDCLSLAYLSSLQVIVACYIWSRFTFNSNRFISDKFIILFRNRSSKGPTLNSENSGGPVGFGNCIKYAARSHFALLLTYRAASLHACGNDSVFQSLRASHWKTRNKKKDVFLLGDPMMNGHSFQFLGIPKHVKVIQQVYEMKLSEMGKRKIASSYSFFWYLVAKSSLPLATIFLWRAVNQ